MPPKVMREPRAAGTSPASARRSTPMATCSGWGTGVPGCVRRHATCTVYGSSCANNGEGALNNPEAQKNGPNIVLFDRAGRPEGTAQGWPVKLKRSDGGGRVEELGKGHRLLFGRRYSHDPLLVLGQATQRAHQHLEHVRHVLRQVLPLHGLHEELDEGEDALDHPEVYEGRVVAQALPLLVGVPAVVVARLPHHR
eukprot:1187115-Prorocentrum_minimum.AAC.1